MNDAITDEELQRRLRVLLPPIYEVFDEAVRPVSMGSAALKVGPDGRVLWGEMWGSFCDLAMAGGPPHRGSLLVGASAKASAEGTARYAEVAAEICRGIGLVTGLCAEPAGTPGWVRMYCPGAAMAGWLMRAITMENVSAVAEGLALDLPCGAEFRVEKEIKNVITAVAKSCHYWQDHMPEDGQAEVARLLRTMDRERPLLQPRRVSTLETVQALGDRIAGQVSGRTGLELVTAAAGWVGFPCQDVASAIWRMRALVALNVLARREGTAVFAAVDTLADPHGNLVLSAFRQVEALWQDRGRSSGFTD